MVRERLSTGAGKFASDVTWSLVSIGVVALAGAVLNLLIGNRLGPGGLGLYSLVLAVYFFVGTTVGGLGVPQAVVKYVAEASDDENARGQLLRTALLLTFLSGLAFTGLVFSGAGWLAHLLHMPRLAPLLRLLSGVFPLFLANKTFSSWLNGRREMRWAAVLDGVRYALMLGATWLLLPRWGLNGSVYALWIPEIVLLVVVLLCVVRGVREGGSKIHKWLEQGRDLLSFGWKMMFALVLGALNTRVDVFLIGYFLTEREVGVYSAALLLVNGLLILPSAIQRVVYPALSKYHGEGNTARMEDIVNRSIHYSLLFLGLATLLLCLWIRPVLHLLYSSQGEFMNAAGPFLILMLGMVIYGAITPIGPAPASGGRPDLNSKIAAVSLILNAGLNVWLVPRYGLVGSAAATAAASMVCALLVMEATRRVLAVRLELRRWAKIYGAFVLLMVLGLLFRSRIHPALSTVLLVIAYAGSLRLIGAVSPGDIQLWKRVEKEWLFDRGRAVDVCREEQPHVL